MLAPGVYARAGLRHPLAVDVGSSMIRMWTPSRGVVVDEPAVIAYGPSGSRRAVGRAALDLAGRTGARLVWPVRDGVIDNFATSVHLLRVLIEATGRPRDDRSPVLVGVPATATLRQKNLLTAALRRAVDGAVTTVEEPLAAALACQAALDEDQDLVAVDIGHGRTEVVRIAERAVAAAERVDVSNMVDQVPAIAEAVRRMALSRARRSRRRLLITGGGAACPGVAGRLAALTCRTVTMPTNPSLATVTGLRLLLTA